MADELLIGYDGTGTSDDALSLGLRLARDLGARPVVVATFRLPQFLVVPQEIEEALHALSEPVLEHVRSRAGDLDCETLALTDGSPARALTEVAGARAPIAIVIGSAHRGAVGRLLLGSVGRSLLSGSPCPVIVAPKGYASGEAGPISRIGVGLDGSEESWGAFEAAGALARRLGAELHAIAVLHPPPPDVPGAVLSIFSAGEVEARAESRVEALLREAESRAPGGLTVRSHLRRGEPGNELASAAAEAALDVLVLGSRGYGPLRSALLGSTSGEVASSAALPVLVLPRGAGASSLDPASKEAGAGAGAG